LKSLARRGALPELFSQRGAENRRLEALSTTCE
jgi:hypothetical protein